MEKKLKFLLETAVSKTFSEQTANIVNKYGSSIFCVLFIKHSMMNVFEKDFQKHLENHKIGIK